MLLPTNIYAIIGVIIATFVAAYGSLYLKKGSATFTLSLFKAIKNIPLLIGVFFYFFSSIIFIISIKYGELSVLYPIASLNYIWSIFLAMKYLGEKMNTFKWMGIFLIMVGVVLIGVS